MFRQLASHEWSSADVAVDLFVLVVVVFHLLVIAERLGRRVGSPAIVLVADVLEASVFSQMRRLVLLQRPPVLVHLVAARVRTRQLRRLRVDLCVRLQRFLRLEVLRTEPTI